MSTFVAEVPDKAEVLMEAFWPGPLTIIFKKKEGVLAESATAGLGDGRSEDAGPPGRTGIVEKLWTANCRPECQQLGQTESNQCPACLGRFKWKNCRSD